MCEFVPDDSAFFQKVDKRHGHHAQELEDLLSVILAIMSVVCGMNCVPGSPPVTLAVRRCGGSLPANPRSRQTTWERRHLTFAIS
ncbi:hypothetical protein ACSF6V_11330 [Escherichia coli]|uniref:hypothetical protein n=1 Tax=Escherichia coli TaxID=562 RepID=UPI003EEE13CA